jgi:pSer/pThr/pTyr-binding forkhead associated (FHA) protein
MNEVNVTVTGNVRILRRERGPRRHSLEQIEGDGSSAQVALAFGETVIGRGSDTQIRLSSKKASRQHAILKVRGTDCLLLDNDSNNGVFLNGVKIHSAILREGDVIQVADSVFVYHED